MKEYFYADGTEKLGPFTLDELKNKGVKPNTLVWKEGMANWQEARMIDELRPIITLSSPPPLPPTPTVAFNQPVQYHSTTSPKAKSRLGFMAGLVVGACILIAIGIFYLNQSQPNSTPKDLVLGSTRGIVEPRREKTPEEIKLDLKSKEEAKPLKYLSVTYDVNTAFDGRARIRGKITNNASVAKFKDVVIRMTFYTKTDTKISTEDKTLFEFLDPTSSKSFDWKIRTPNKTDKVGLQVADATVVNPSAQFE